ncbi:hypothetical protein F5890DRAFT_1648867 [Lentinula detonsa]|uniref:Retrotransposon gag domain-containing protein n=1 Tax=Lentinula detonsa TaxID=2804962 RepID=A0AA38PNJ8_9AGAR|nr:hypothetical protein F5890DRAFT_1648867 [Lentinula detonsa]
MSAIIPLPSRNKRSALKFDPNNEAHLPTFFEEFEKVAEKAGINTDYIKLKKEVLRYVDVPTMRFWKTLDAFTNDQKDWDSFVKEVLENYPDAQQAPEANEAELTKIVDKYKKSGIDGTRDLAKYHWEFVAVATALKNQGTMSAVQVAKAYVRVLPDGLKNRLETRLQVQIPMKQKGIAYTLPQIRSAIEFLISDASTPFATEDFRVGDHGVVPEQKKSYVSPKTDPNPKEELEDSVVSHLTRQLLALTQVVNKMVDGQSFRPFDPSISSTDSQARKPKLCYWDGCVSDSIAFILNQASHRENRSKDNG